MAQSQSIVQDNLIGYSSKDGMCAFRLQFKNNEQMWRVNFTENVKGGLLGK